jgi:hypothetical protein
VNHSEVKIPALSNVGRRLNVCDVTIIVFLDIIHRPVLFRTHNVSETGFCLRLVPIFRR